MSKETPHILLLDDDEDVLGMLRLFLSLLKVEVDAFSDPNQAIDFFKAHSDCIDCFFCDLVMHPINGLGILQQTRAISADTPFYLMSANASEQDLKRAQELHVTGFIEKPMVHLELEKIINRIAQ